MILRRELRPEARPPSLRFRPPNVHLPLWLIGTGWACVGLWRGLCWFVQHPRSTVVLFTAAVLVVTNTVLPALVVALAAGGVLCLWWALDPTAVQRHVLEPAQLRLREWFTYRRHWQPAMLTAGLSLRDSWGGDLPTLRRVGSDAGRDVLRVRMLPGQTLEQWTAAAPALAQTFGARAVRVRRVPNRPQELGLLVTRRGAQTRHVTERAVEQEPEQVPAPRGAFPRAPRGGAA